MTARKAQCVTCAGCAGFKLLLSAYLRLHASTPQVPRHPSPKNTLQQLSIASQKVRLLTFSDAEVRPAHSSKAAILSILIRSNLVYISYNDKKKLKCTHFWYVCTDNPNYNSHFSTVHTISAFKQVYVRTNHLET